MSHSVDVVDVSAEPADALDCFRSESQATSEARPSVRRMRIGAARRLKKRRPVRGRFQSALYASLFAGGLFVGALLTGPGTPSGTTPETVATVGAVQKPPAPTVNVVAARDEQGIASSDRVVDASAEAPANGAVVRRAKTVRRSENDAPARPARTRAPGYRGTLIVTSAPRGASVFVNGQLKGETPLELHGQPAGSRALRLDLDGYARWSRAINVIGDNATIVSANLNRAN